MFDRGEWALVASAKLLSWFLCWFPDARWAFHTAGDSADVIYTSTQDGDKTIYPAGLQRGQKNTDWYCCRGKQVANAGARAYKNVGIRVRPPLLEMLEVVMDISFLESLTWWVNRSAAELKQCSGSHAFQEHPPGPRRDPRPSQLNVWASARLQQVIRQDRVSRCAPTCVRRADGGLLVLQLGDGAGP